MARLWAGTSLALVLAISLPAHADKVRPAVDLGYDGIIMAGDDVKFENPLHGGSLGVLMYLTKRNPVLVRIGVNLQGDRPETLDGKKVLRFVSGLKWNVGMGIGKGRFVLPYVMVGLGPQFMTIRHEIKSRVAEWAWTIALEGQVGFIFRVKKAFGFRLAAGFTSLSFYSRKENLGGAWVSAALLLGIPGARPYEPPPEPYYPPEPSYQPPSWQQHFYFDAWVVSLGGDPARPVLQARLIRDAGFEEEVSVWVELPDGSEYEMHRAGLEDPDLYEVRLYSLGIECGDQWVTVKGKTGFIEREQAVQAYLPCPQIPGGP